MDFKTEYKAAAESMTPSREQLDRMKANILSQTAKPRKPAFTRAAYIGGTVAACAVVTLTAVTLLPVLKDAGKLTNSNQSVLSGSSAPETDSNKGIAFWDNETAKDTAAAADSEFEETPVCEDNADCVPTETAEFSHEIAIDDAYAESEEWTNDEGAENPGMAGEVPVVPNDVTGSGIVDTVLTDKSDNDSTADNGAEITDAEEPADFPEETEAWDEPEEWDYAETAEEMECITEEWTECETAEFDETWLDETECAYEETMECEYSEETCESASETMEEDWVDYEKPIEHSPPDLDPTEAIYRPNKLILSDNQKTLWLSYRYPRLSGTFKYTKTDFTIDVSAETDFPAVFESAKLSDVRSGRTFRVEFTTEDTSSFWLYDDSGHFIGEYIKE